MKNQIPEQKMAVTKQKGFSLVEMITVLGIVSILFAIGLTGLNRWRPNFQLKGDAESFYVNLQRARVHAIKTNRTVTVLVKKKNPASVNFPRGKYTMTDDAGASLADEVMGDGTSLENTTFPTNAAGDYVVEFNSRGFSSNNNPAVVTFGHDKIGDTYTVTIGASGNIKIQK